MADVRIDIDANTTAAETKVERLKGSIAGLEKGSKGWAETLAKSASLGAGEGALAKGLGSVASGFGMITLAALAAGSAWRAYSSASQRAIDDVKEQVSWAERLAQAMKRGDDARAGTAAGGLSQAQLTRQLISRGGKMSDVRGLADQGFDWQDALRAVARTAQLRGKDVLLSQAAAIARTGDSDLNGALDALLKQPGGVKGMDGLSRVLTGIRGQRLTSENLFSSRESLLRSAAATGGDAVSSAVRAGNLVPEAQAGDLASGATATALRDRAADTLNPAAAAVRELAAEAQRAQASLDAAARAQGRVAAAMADLGLLMGGEGSETMKGVRFRRNAAVGLGGRD